VSEAGARALLDRRSRLERAEDTVWAQVPGRAWGRSPVWGLLLSDGGWLRAWPRAGLAGPATAGALGLSLGALRPADAATYSSSLIWLLLLMIVCLAGCGVAFWGWGGFVLADLLFGQHPPAARFGESLLPVRWLTGFVMPQAVAYLLLATLLVGVPFTALLVRGSVDGLLRSRPGGGGVIAAVAGAIAAAVQAAAWTQAFPLLVRPLWTWRRLSPPASAIEPVQSNPMVFAAVAFAGAVAAAVAAAVGLERIRGRRLQPVASLEGSSRQTERSAADHVRGALIRAAASTLLLAGLIDTYVRGAVAFAVLALAFVTQAVILPRTAVARWWTGRVPFGVRLLTALALAWLVAWQVGRQAVTTYAFGISFITASDFSPLLWASVAAMAVTAVILPGRAPTLTAGPGSGRRAPADRGGPP
jgi:hypothetical protein